MCHPFTVTLAVPMHVDMHPTLLSSPHCTDPKCKRCKLGRCALWTCPRRPPAMLTGVILRGHGPGEHLSEGVQPLSLLSLLLAHEEILSPGRSHRDAVLPLVPPSMHLIALLYRVTLALCADENDPQLLRVLRAQA